MALVQYPELISGGADTSGDPATAHLKEYYERIGQWADAALEEGVGLQKDVPELREMSTAIDYLSGLQWKESMPSYRAKPVSNEMLAMFWETVGLLTDVKPMFHISDIGDQGYSQIEDVLNKMARGWAATSSFEHSLAMCTMFGTMTTAPAKIYWNPFARGTSGDPSDGDISFENIPISSLLRLGINDPQDIDGDECVIYRRVRTLAWIKRAYPNMGKFVTPQESVSRYSVDTQAPLDVMPNLFESLGAPMKRLVGGREGGSIQSCYPRAEVIEYWKKDDDENETGKRIIMGPQKNGVMTAPWSYVVEPGKKLYPRGRLIIRANHVTLYDEPNPYFHRKYPFELLGLNAVPWQQYALSLLSPWMKQQDILNQIMAGVVQCVKKAINPPLLAAKQAINPEAMRAIDSSKPNLKITWNANGGQAPTWGQPPNVPAYVFQAYGTVMTSMKQASGSQAIGDAAQKKQVPGGDTMDKITFAKNTPIRMMGRNIETFIDKIGMMWTANALQFYDAGRRMEMMGPKGLVKEDMDANPGSLIPADISSEAFVRRWNFKSDKGTLLNVQRQDKIQVSFALRKNHDLSRRKLFQQLDWNINLDENDAELQKEAEAMAAAQAAAGPKKGKK